MGAFEAYLQDWLRFLRDTNGAAAVPLIVAGGVLMLLGWRMWRACVVLAFGLVGAGVVYHYVGSNPNRVLFAILGGAVLGAAAYKPAKWAIGALGGLIAAGVISVSLSQFGLSVPTLGSLAAAAMIMSGAYAVLHRQHVVVLVTSFLGTALLLSGLATLGMNSAGLTRTFASMSSYSGIVIPFVLLVPTVMGSFYQISEMRRLGVTF